MADAAKREPIIWSDGAFGSIAYLGDLRLETVMRPDKGWGFVVERGDEELVARWFPYVTMEDAQRAAEDEARRFADG